MFFESSNWLSCEYSLHVSGAALPKINGKNAIFRINTKFIKTWPIINLSKCTIMKKNQESDTWHLLFLKFAISQIHVFHLVRKQGSLNQIHNFIVIFHLANNPSYINLPFFLPKKFLYTSFVIEKSGQLSLLLANNTLTANNEKEKYFNHCNHFNCSRESRQILSYLSSCTFWRAQYFLLLLAFAHRLQDFWWKGNPQKLDAKTKCY